MVTRRWINMMTQMNQREPTEGTKKKNQQIESECFPLTQLDYRQITIIHLFIYFIFHMRYFD